MYKVNNASEINERFPFVVIFLYDGEWWYWGSYSTKEDAENARREWHNADGIVVEYEEIEVLW